MVVRNKRTIHRRNVKLLKNLINGRGSLFIGVLRSRQSRNFSTGPGRKLPPEQRPWCRLHRAQSRCSCPVAAGAWPLFRISATWSPVITPPMIVCCQSSLDPINAPVPLCSSNVGLAKGSGTLNCPSSGPIARMITRLAPIP